MEQGFERRSRGRAGERDIHPPSFDFQTVTSGLRKGEGCQAQLRLATGPVPAGLRLKTDLPGVAVDAMAQT